MPDPDPFAPLDPADFGYWEAQHLVNRAGFGAPPAFVHQLVRLGFEESIRHLIDYEGARYRGVFADDFEHDLIRPFTQAELDARRSGRESVIARMKQDRQRRQAAERRQITAFRRWWIGRMRVTPRPLEEKMVLFWHGHFATSYSVVRDSYHMFQQNLLFRKHAIGNFRELAHGIVRDPAMLRYLDNNQNRKARPNENLAREIMELFTLGEGVGYTERDIKEAARALTGFTFADDAFSFREEYHDTGVKEIFGQRGRWDGHGFIDLVLEKPDSRRFLAEKLYRFFVNDLPNGPDDEAAQVIEAMAQRLQSSSQQILSVLLALFRSKHFYLERNRANQIKSPIQLIVQTMRSLETPERDPDSLLSGADRMGQNLAYPPSVRGWLGGRAWINTGTLFVRQNMSIYQLTGRAARRYGWKANNAPYDASRLLEALRATTPNPTPRDIAAYLLKAALGAPPYHARIETVAAHLGTHPRPGNSAAVTSALAIITAMPEFQLC